MFHFQNPKMNYASNQHFFNARLCAIHHKSLPYRQPVVIFPFEFTAALCRSDYRALCQHNRVSVCLSTLTIPD
jgi:hypothetical protein